MKKIIAVFAFVLLVNSVYAYVPFGHHTVAALADKYLTEKARGEVQTILKSNMIKQSNWLNSLRKKEAISVKQPLQRIAIPAMNAELQARIEAMKQLILDEVNVKEIEFVDGASMLVKKVKCNFRTMGKKFGKQMKSVAAAVALMDQSQIAQLEQGCITLIVEGTDALIELEDVEIYSEDIPGWSVTNAGTLTVALDLTITEELRLEGMAREIIRSIQQLRKDSGFEITDRIIVTLPDNDDVRACLSTNYDYVTSQVLATEVRFAGDSVAVEKL